MQGTNRHYKVVGSLRTTRRPALCSASRWMFVLNVLSMHNCILSSSCIILHTAPKSVSSVNTTRTAASAVTTESSAGKLWTGSLGCSMNTRKDPDEHGVVPHHVAGVFTIAGRPATQASIATSRSRRPRGGGEWGLPCRTTFDDLLPRVRVPIQPQQTLALPCCPLHPCGSSSLSLPLSCLSLFLSRLLCLFLD